MCFKSFSLYIYIFMYKNSLCHRIGKCLAHKIYLTDGQVYRKLAIEFEGTVPADQWIPWMEDIFLFAIPTRMVDQSHEGSATILHVIEPPS